MACEAFGVFLTVLPYIPHVECSNRLVGDLVENVTSCLLSILLSALEKFVLLHSDCNTTIRDNREVWTSRQ